MKFGNQLSKMPSRWVCLQQSFQSWRYYLLELGAVSCKHWDTTPKQRYGMLGYEPLKLNFYNTLKQSWTCQTKWMLDPSCWWNKKNRPAWCPCDSAWSFTHHLSRQIPWSHVRGWCSLCRNWLGSADPGSPSKTTFPSSSHSTPWISHDETKKYLHLNPSAMGC